MADHFVEGDTGSTISVTCKDTAGAAIDLTGSTVHLIWINEASDALVTVAMTNDPDQVTNKGVATYTFVADDLFHPRMTAEVEVTDNALHVTTSLQAISWNVRKRLAV